jgi:hypothetical protein
MARYYFHIYDDMDVLDEEGTDLPDAATALIEATRAARALAAAQVLKGYLKLHHRINVVDQAGQVIDAVRFGDAVAVEADEASA